MRKRSLARSSAENAFRASVYSQTSDTSKLFGNTRNSFREFVSEGNQRKLIISGATNDQVTQIAEKLSSNPSIERIHIFNSKANESSFFKLLTAIKQTPLRNLESIDLHNNQLSSKFLQFIFKEPVKFSCIDLSFNNFTVVPKFDAVISAPPLTLYLDNNPKIQFVERLFEQLPTLTYCALAGNQIEDDDIVKISQTINALKHSIAALDISHNCIGDAGCLALCNFVLQQECSALRNLSIQGNPFGVIGRQELIKGLQISPSITNFKPEEIFEEAELLRKDYPGKDQLTSWLQQLSLESSRSAFYKHQLSLDGLLVCDLSILSSELKPNDMHVLQEAIDSLKKQFKDNLYLLTTIQYQANAITEVEILYEVASGYSSIIYKGTWQRTIPVIIKQFKEANIYHLKNEFNILCYLKHPNIIQCYGTTIINSRDTLVFEEGLGDYFFWCKSHSPSISQKVQFCQDIARSLIFLKQKRIVHRDLSLRNIIIFEKSNGKYFAKLTDFGLAAFTQPNSVRDQTTPNYYEVPSGSLVPVIESSPESYYQHSAQSDVWAFGILMWEMFESKIDHREARRLLSGRVPMPVHSPDYIYQIICRSLLVDETRRASIEEIFSSLTEISQSTIT